MNTILKWVFIALTIAGVGVSYFTTIPAVDITALAVAFCSAGALFGSTLNKGDKKDWKTYVSTICITIGAFGLGFAGVSSEIVSKVVSAVIGLIALVIGIVMAVKADKKTA